MQKFIFIILGAVIVIELILAFRTLQSPTPPPQQAVKPLDLTGGKIALTVTKTDFKVGEQVPVLINIDTGGYTIDGADVIVSFNPASLEASSAGITKGPIFDEYPSVLVDSQKGTISVSGIKTLKEGFKGQGEFAMINFRAKAKGAAFLTIDFLRGQTTDSNLVETETSKDILNEVSNLEIIIK